MILSSLYFQLGGGLDVSYVLTDQINVRIDDGEEKRSMNTQCLPRKKMCLLLLHVVHDAFWNDLWSACAAQVMKHFHTHEDRVIFCATLFNFYSFPFPSAL